MSTQEPLAVAADIVRHLKVNLRECSKIVCLARKAGGHLVKSFEYDWQVFASILWNQLLAII